MATNTETFLASLVQLCQPAQSTADGAAILAAPDLLEVAQHSPGLIHTGTLQTVKSAQASPGIFMH